MKKVISAMLSVLLVLSALPFAGLTAFAADSVTVASGGGETDIIDLTEATRITSETETFSGLMYAENDGSGLIGVENARLSGDTTIVLLDGAVVEFNGALVCNDYSLTVYAEADSSVAMIYFYGSDGTDGEGTLYPGSTGGAGLAANCGILGNLTVYGGDVYVYGGDGGNGGYGGVGGIGGNGGAGIIGNVTVYGGKVRIEGGDGGYGGKSFLGNYSEDGCGEVAIRGNIIVEGGELTLVGGDSRIAENRATAIGNCSMLKGDPYGCSEEGVSGKYDPDIHINFYPVYKIYPVHIHSFAEEYSRDEIGHWYSCTAPHCRIADYASCGIEAAGYAVHTGMDDDFTCDICGYTETSAQLEAAKEAAIEQIEEAAGEDRSYYVQYVIVNTAKETIADASTLAKVEAALAEALGSLEAQLAAEAFDGIRAGAYIEVGEVLEGYVNGSAYVEEVLTAIEDRLSKSSNADDIEKAMEWFYSLLKNLTPAYACEWCGEKIRVGTYICPKCSLENTAKKLEDAKANAIAELTEAAGDEVPVSVETAFENAKTAIMNADNVDSVNTLLADGIDTINNLFKDIAAAEKALADARAEALASLYEYYETVEDYEFTEIEEIIVNAMIDIGESDEESAVGDIAGGAISAAETVLLENAKTAAADELADLAGELEKDGYDDIADYVTAAVDGLDGLGSVDEIEKYVDAVKAAADNKISAKELNAVKDNAIAEVKAAAEAFGDSADDIVAEAVSAIGEAVSEEEIDGIVKEALAKINELPEPGEDDGEKTDIESIFVWIFDILVRIINMIKIAYSIVA